MACNIPLESSQQGLQLCFRPHFNRRFADKVTVFKVVGVPILRISGLSFGTKCHLDVSPVARHKIYYKGESGGFPQVQAVVSLVNPSLLGARTDTKSALTMH